MNPLAYAIIQKTTISVQQEPGVASSASSGPLGVSYACLAARYETACLENCRKQTPRNARKMADKQKIRGIFTPNMVPLDERGDINEAELRRYIDWLIDGGVHGLYPNGSNGEFLRFTPEERRRIVRIVADQTASRVPILAGAAEANVRETLAACEEYCGLGVRAVAIVAPFYYKLSPDNVYAYFREIGRNSPIDVTLYNIPAFASPIDVPTVQRLSEECERITGIKDSSGDVGAMIQMIDAVRPNRPDFAFLTGWEAALMPMLLAGCDGGTHATSGVAPQLTRRLYDLTVAGRLDEARKAQTQVSRLLELIFSAADFPEGFRRATEVVGFRMGRGRQPISQEQQLRLDKMEPALRQFLAEEGVGVDSAPSTFDPGQVGKIVTAVIAELQHRGAI